MQKQTGGFLFLRLFRTFADAAVDIYCYFATALHARIDTLRVSIISGGFAAFVVSLRSPFARAPRLHIPHCTK